MTKIRLPHLCKVSPIIRMRRNNVKRSIIYLKSLGWAYRALTGGFLLLRNSSVAISLSPHVCFILVLILISMFLR